MPNPKGMNFITAALASNSLDCILWPYTLHRGYGRMEPNGKRIRVHRYVCERAHGPAPHPDYGAAHLCGVKACINPRHLRWSSRSQNATDRIIHALGANVFAHPDYEHATYRLQVYPDYLKPT
jgi:HNH endonuclease